MHPLNSQRWKIGKKFVMLRPAESLPKAVGPPRRIDTRVSMKGIATQIIVNHEHQQASSFVLLVQDETDVDRLQTPMRPGVWIEKCLEKLIVSGLVKKQLSSD
jgi:hypothetical protein